MFSRLASHWVYGGFLAGWLLLGLLPIVTHGWLPALVLVYLTLPIYMLHQFEEHDRDRFRLFANEVLGHGREVLSREYVFFVNVPGVWGVNLASILLAAFVNPGYGLIALYLMLVNAFAHVQQAILLRRSNPGLITALALFFPLSIAGVLTLRDVGAGYHALGLGVALAIHASIIVHVKRRAAA